MKIKFILFDFYNVLYFPRENRINEEIIEFLQTNNRKYGFGLLSAVHIDLENWTKERKLNQYFQFVKTTEQLEVSKSEPDVYEMVANSFALKPGQVLFVDDLPENISAAKKAGLQTLLYRPTQSFSKQITQFL
ncbi:MAG: HAD-IA family hydrolase [Candidatus Saccharibacteria bacterium]